VTEPTRYPAGAVCCLVHWPGRDWIALLKKRPHKHEGGLWGCPGGKQEYRESTLAAAWRELREECGLGHNDVRHRGVVGLCEDVVPEIEKHYLCVIHLFVVEDGRVPTLDNVEPEHHSEVGWFPVGRLPRNVTSGFRAVLQQLKKAAPRPRLDCGGWQLSGEPV
jgi:ADP-ribose pyrophosphatase YjhB (NUDIX family)